MNIKKALKTAMLNNDLNQRGLSKKSGVGATTISLIITGKSDANTKTLSRLAAALDIKLSELIALGE